MPDLPNRRLGRGLSALLGDPLAAGTAPHARPEGLVELPVADIHANPDQPRRRIDPAALATLVDSIRRHGLVQPVAVRPDGGGYVLIAGERRWRAAREAGLERVPALIREADEQGRLELALVENLVREDLSPMEVARACAILTEDFAQSHQQVADRLGRARPTVSNLLRLLELPDEVQAMVDRGELSEGHARAVLMADGARDRRLLAERIVAEGLSVREAERLARDRAAAHRAPRAARPDLPPAADDALDAFTAAFDTAVRVRARARGDLGVELRFADENALREAISRLPAP
ncbi:MAG: ParB/RepB/Spo0J family partition protein [Thermoleophilia bacterium]|nr:ParB/RepB/Spo0J family partition protein [Thermoleophilia bacterium]